MGNLTNSNKLIDKIDSLNVVRVSNTAPSNPTLGMAWYDSTSSSKMLKVYNGTSWDIVGPEMVPITQDAYDALSQAEKNNGKYYLITDASGTIIVNWEDIVGAPTIPENTSDLNNDSGFITGINSSDVTTALGYTPYNASNPSGYQTASQVSSAINTALGSVYRYKGSKTTYSQLPTSGQITGDVWNIEQADSTHGIKAGDNVAWNGSAWDVLSGTVDLTNYFNKTNDTSDNITQGTNNLFLTSAERTKLTNTSGTNTGDETAATIKTKLGISTLSGSNTGDETTATIKTKLGAASASQDGYLTKEDFATFNGKQDALTAGDGISITNNVVTNTKPGPTISGTAPSNPVEGQLWYDSTNDQLKVYNGSEWQVTGKEYNAGPGISIGDYTDYSAMRGPCPDGFHIPLITERSGLITIMGNLSLNTGNNWRINLHMPFAGSINDYDASHYQQGTYGNYWSATPNSYSDNTFACVMFIRGDSDVAPNDSSSNRRAYGNTIRPFKDIYETPTSSWTVIQGTLGSAGIFWNQTEGLISITDGTTGYTIMDKNLGATIVYSDGDTLTDNNCGYMYQWGNNYGFPSVSTISNISSTQVDASNYGPGNYYSSNTFIIRTGNPHDWSSVRNNNLWGGDIGIINIENAITNIGVLSVNGQTGDVTIDTGSASSITTTQPSNPVEGDVYYDTTNDVVKVYDGSQWNEVGSDAADINTKTFYLSSTNDLTTAQAAYDWYKAGKNPIIINRSGNKEPYTFFEESNGFLVFIRNYVSQGEKNTSDMSYMSQIKLRFTISSDTVTAINIVGYTAGGYYLRTDYNYSTPYTPLYNGSPATKKYVDDTVTAAKSVGSTAPSNPIEGQLWYDTTNDVLKVYDGTNWVEVGGGGSYSAGDGIDITNNEINAKVGKCLKIGDDYSAIKGPCQEGFHIPTKGEFTNLKKFIITDLGLSGSELLTYLKMPKAGSLSNLGSRSTIDSEAAYRCSTPGDTAYKADYVYIATNFNIGVHQRVSGHSIRPFKDEAIVPDSNWTELYLSPDATGGSLRPAGIYYNATLGLISISSDGDNWITIADKNLGATTVYNSGDTLSYANCGNFYQRGNNYGFSWDGGFTTSNIKIDTTGYGPGDYYSNTFIKTSANQDRSDPSNDNLRGGVTGVIFNAIINTGVTSVNGKSGDVYIGVGDGLKISEDNVINTKIGEGLKIGTGFDYSAIIGPCNEGFHIPTSQEFIKISTYLSTLGFTATAEKYRVATEILKMPPCGVRTPSDGTMEDQGTKGYYWTCTKGSSSGLSQSFCVWSSNVGMYQTNRGRGYSIRPFKNDPIIPDGSWTTEYQLDCGAGIYSNSTLGLISISSDGENWITMTDKNLGATTIYNTTDALSESNCGKLYQWGNNYGFPYTGEITTSSDVVDTTGYGPGNYYSSDTFVTQSYWDNPTNDNLRGGETGIITINGCINNNGVLSVNGKTGNVCINSGDGINIYDNEINVKVGEGLEIGTYKDYSAMRGPCEEGFHVPAKTEWDDLKTVFNSLGLSSGANFREYFKIPCGTSNYKDNNGNIVNVGSSTLLTSTPLTSDNTKVYSLQVYSSISTSAAFYKSYAINIRPFKDKAIIPNNDWVVLYQGTGNAGIYHDSIHGIISISSDGTNWTTIADKNLGATEVYNYGDTVTLANRGSIFQWGNDYGFGRTETLTTDSNQIDTTGYGPNNHYLSSTFITGNNDWSNPTNNNLRGGETGIITINNAINNIGVLSVNGKCGEIYIDEGEGIDISENNKINAKVGGGLEIGTYKDYSAIKGPCPEGYHIPTWNELTTLYSYMDSLGLTDTGTNFKEKLHLPNAQRLRQDTGQKESGNYAYLISCEMINNTSVRVFQIHDSTIYHSDSTFNSKSSGNTIRPFKNKSINPISNGQMLKDGWAREYHTDGTGYGIAHNVGIGLLSISADGTSWITMADKNQGATTVWNSGDTLTSANVGKYFQWGNNYGFDITGAVNTSSTKPDASNYGPGNYYYNDTFITGATQSNAEAWDNPSNMNLRGGVTGIIISDNTIINTGVISETVISGDIGTTYIIKSSTAAPASGTANNIITLVL